MTIKYSEEPNEVYYFPPSLEYDIMETKAQLKTPVLRESKDLIELRDEGIVLCSMPVTNSTRFKVRQNEFLFLAKLGQVPLGAITISALTANNNKKGQHRFIFDDANRRVKLSGPYAGPLGEGPWITLEEN